MTFKISFLQVGNADCTILRSPDVFAIVDIPKVGPLNDWLMRHKICVIHRVFVTHDHSDHFLGLERLAKWIEAWRGRGGHLGKLHLPDGLWEKATRRLESFESAHETNTLRYQRLHNSLERIRIWNQAGELKIYSLRADQEHLSDGALSFEILHPSWMDVETQRATKGTSPNEGSLVLRLRYGEFAALLLADLEGDGLASLMDRVKLRSASIRCNVLKIPHHGAWPKNPQELLGLLEQADPEMAVLSVGSTNNYGHVRPELFRALLGLKDRDDLRLRLFACTEVTRTCVLPATDRLPDGHGLPAARSCAGEILVEAERDGHWNWPGERGHDETVKHVQMAACVGQAELS